MKQLPCGVIIRKVYITFVKYWDEMASYGMPCSYAQTKNRNTVTLAIDVALGSIKGENMEEKRRSKRLELDVTIQLERLHEGEITTVKYTHVDITDVSRSGIGFKTTQEFSLGTYYDTKIQIWTKEVVDAVIEIVRCDKGEDGVFHYGCTFIGMTDTDALKIEIYQMFNEM